MFQAAQMMRKPAGMTSRNYGTYLDGIRQVRRKQMPYSTAYGANIYDSIRLMTPVNKPDIGSILGSFMQGVGPVPATGVFSQQPSATQAAAMNAMRGQAAQSNLLPSQGMTMGGGAMISGSNMPSNVTAANNMDMLRSATTQQASANPFVGPINPSATVSQVLPQATILPAAAAAAPAPTQVYGPANPAGTTTPTATLDASSTTIKMGSPRPKQKFGGQPFGKWLVNQF